MDQEGGTAMVIISLIFSVGGAIITALNHTRIRSACCGKKIEMSIDIDKSKGASPSPEQSRAPTIVVT